MRDFYTEIRESDLDIGVQALLSKPPKFVAMLKHLPTGFTAESCPCADAVEAERLVRLSLHNYLRATAKTIDPFSMIH